MKQHEKQKDDAERLLRDETEMRFKKLEFAMRKIVRRLG